MNLDPSPSRPTLTPRVYFYKREYFKPQFEGVLGNK